MDDQTLLVDQDEVTVPIVPTPVGANPSKPSWNPKMVLMAADFAVVAIALAIAIELSGVAGNNAILYDRHRMLLGAAFAAPFWVLVFSYFKLYSVRFVTRINEEFTRIVQACVTATILMTFGSVLIRLPLTRAWIVVTVVCSTVLVTAERSVARWAFNRQRAAGKLLRAVIVVGGNHEATEIIRMLEEDRSLGYSVRGFVDDDGVGDLNLEHYGTYAQTLAAVRATESTGVIIAATAMDLGTSNRLIRELTDQGIHVELSSTLRDIASNRLTMRPLGRFPVVYVEPVQRNGWRMHAKRVFDIALAAGGLLVAGPALIVAAVAIKLDSPGPVLFKQERMGKNRTTFRCLKLRTMGIDAEARLAELRAQNEVDGPLFKMARDPRITRVGRILRKLSIDELPQLWNVLRGEMSMVGPRPALPREVDAWSEALHGRLRVKPGLTGMWQVNGRSSSNFADYERLDLYYVDNWSLATDLMIVAKTIPAVLMSRGAM